MDAPAAPLQIDLIKDMGVHLFKWYYKAQRGHQWEKEREKRRWRRVEEKRRAATSNQKEHSGELMNELLICIEIAGLRN